ncbi:DNA polymerase III subunit beta [Dysgonomonas macrotermitis]|uniref:Beta sliding clamp n=1 Tax=Dysgonomonas macrotermitis TaxID=1346286 RepID=A0A1M5C6P3_9BACT|nr:DNA polymerase III subunit beta [Dysgonomonas macrotermitis]SHF50277.1 DNA polymerase III beta subunit, central domain [Dysgonomonas macrotermitis]
MTSTITISSSELLKRLISVSKIISPKSTLPILENILLNIQDGKVNISAADYQGRMNTSIEGILTDNNISICIEPKLIIEALKTLPEQPITIIIDDKLGITVKYKGGKFELVGKAPDEYPKDKSTNDTTKLSISAKVLLNGIEKTSFCSANDELRPVMNGVYFDVSAGRINFVASDGHKLALLEHADDSINETINMHNPNNKKDILLDCICPDCAKRYTRTDFFIKAEPYYCILSKKERNGFFSDYSDERIHKTRQEMIHRRITPRGMLQRFNCVSGKEATK